MGIDVSEELLDSILKIKGCSDGLIKNTVLWSSALKMESTGKFINDPPKRKRILSVVHFMTL
jgi:hypothetical protein